MPRRITEAAIARAERAAWEAAHLGPDGDYIELDNNRVVKKADYDPATHGAGSAPLPDLWRNEGVMIEVGNNLGFALLVLFTLLGVAAIRWAARK